MVAFRQKQAHILHGPVKERPASVNEYVRFSVGNFQHNQQDL